MKIKAFKKLYSAINELEDEVTNWSPLDDELKKNRFLTIAIFDTNGHILSSLGITFLEELDINILKSSAGKIDIIKFYLYELKEINRFFNDIKYQKIIYQFGFYDNSFSIKENLIIAIHHIYIFITTELQYCCIKYNIDFSSICKEVDFDCSSINNIYLLTVESKKKKNKKKQKENKTTHEGGFSKEKKHNNLNLKENIKNIPSEINEKHGHVFCNNGFILFEHLLNENYIRPKGVKGRYADISFFYRKMEADKFINAGDEKFRLWFIEENNEEFSKIIISNNTTDIVRRDNYIKAIDWFKLQKP